jgi:hypothetical protein
MTSFEDALKSGTEMKEAQEFYLVDPVVMNRENADDIFTIISERNNLLASMHKTVLLLQRAQLRLAPDDVVYIFHQKPNKTECHYWRDKWLRSKGNVINFCGGLDPITERTFLDYIEKEMQE